MCETEIAPVYAPKGCEMAEEIETLIEKLKLLEDEIEASIEAKREKFYSEIKEGKAKFDDVTVSAHKALKIGIEKYFFKSNVATIITMPFIYGMIFPFIFLDFTLLLFQYTCFAAWGVPRVKRADYIVIDRYHLQYLNSVEKLNCVFCGYGNGLFAYAREISSRTEQYWCPIKHMLRPKAAHSRYKDFAEFGDAEGFKRTSNAFREALRNMKK